jgi:hypothetical protein
MGTVYKALHTSLKRVVAIKVLPPERVHDPHFLARFRREMEAVGKLNHPHVVQATDAGEAGGRHFLVMEFIDGPNLARVVELCGPLAVADACELARQAALGLQGAHEHGLVHRDVKPSNLILAPGGRVKLLDLGLVRLLGDAPVTELTGSGQALGTPDFMAPEQGSGSRGVDIRADLYSLGCTLYKLLAGEPPFGGPEYDSALKKLRAHAEVPPPPIRGRREDVPEGLAAVLDRLLAKDPDGRYATPAEVAATLEPFAAGSDLTGLLQAARAREPRRPEPAVPPPGSTLSASTLARADDLAPPEVEGAVASPPGAGPGERSRLPAVLGALLALGTLVGGLALAFHLLLPPSSPSTEGPPIPPELPRELLTRAPEVIAWPEPPGNSAHWIDPGRNALHVTCQGLGLLALGTAPGPGYRLTLAIEQSGWQGRIGCFFGLRELEEGGERFLEYQRIELAPGLPRGGAAAFEMCRLVARVKVAGKKHIPVTDETVAQQSLPPLRLGEQTLELTVGKGGLERVVWGSTS